MKQMGTAYRLSYALSLVIAFILVILPFHELLVVWIGSHTGHLDWVRVWKEILMLAMLPAGLWLAWHDKTVRSWALRSWVVRLYVLYVLLHAALGAWAYTHHQVIAVAWVYAMIINLRFIYFFILCAVVAAYCGFLRRNWAKLLLIPSGLVIIFGLLQKFALPYDFLRHLGYGPQTAPAYQTVDANLDYSRVQSSLRGANPLGAYLVLVIPALFAWLPQKRLRNRLLVGGTAILALIVLFYSYSRSAWVGLALALLVLAWLSWRRLSGKWLLVGAAIILIAAGVLYGFRSNQTVQDILLHTSSNSASPESSNQLHDSAIKRGYNDVVNQPLGRGPGTAGPASYRNFGHFARIAEDYYLQIGQEVGVIGMVLFVAINILVGRQLWLRRAAPLARVLLASLVGISFINLLSHAWTDDTLSLLWWGLAGIACSPVIMKTKHNQKDGKKIPAPA